MNTNTSSLMRRVAKHLDRDPDNARPRADEPGRQAGLALIEAGLVLYFDTDPALARARDFGGRGYAGGSTAEGRGKGGHSSPTEAAATDLPAKYTSNSGPDHLTKDHPDFVKMAPGHGDGFAVEGDELRSVLAEAQGVAADAVKRTKRLLSTAPPVTESEDARCAEWVRGCGDLAVKAGRCAADYEYIRSTGASHVPEEIITERRRTRSLAS